MFDQAVWLIMWLEHWTYNFEALIASPTLLTTLDLFMVVPRSNPR